LMLFTANSMLKTGAKPICSLIEVLCRNYRGVAILRVNRLETKKASCKVSNNVAGKAALNSLSRAPGITRLKGDSNTLACSLVNGL
jgi:hypothetical protein